MIRFDTQEQKEFVLSALESANVPLKVADRAHAILVAVQNAAVGPCDCHPKGDGESRD